MASELVRRSLSAVIEEHTLQLDSHRIRGVKELVGNILKKISDGEPAVTAFDAFATELVSTLRSAFSSHTTFRSSAAKREKVWSAFHQLRVAKLPSLWTKFLESIDVEADDQLLQQSVNSKTLEMLLPEQFASQASAQPERVG